MYLNKELSLLSSILDAYPEYVIYSYLLFFYKYYYKDYTYCRAEKSPEAKEQFLRQLENIDIGVKQTLDRVNLFKYELIILN